MADTVPKEDAWDAAVSVPPKVATRIATLEAENASLLESWFKLWGALADIAEQPGSSPNATVRRMAAIAEKALVEDDVSDVKPVPRFYVAALTTGGTDVLP